MLRARSLIAAAAILAAAAFGLQCDDDAATVSASSGASATSGASSTTSAASSGAGGAAEAIHVTGTVTDGQAPLPGAIVLQGGGAPQVVTGADGRFDVVLSTTLPGTPTLVAGKPGYRSAGLELDALTGGDVVLELREASPPDDLGYAFGDPGTGDAAHDNSTAYCGHCHTTLVAQFQTSAHARATRDPWVQDLYAGVASSVSSAGACASRGGEMRAGIVPGDPTMTALKCYVGGGVLPDLNGCGGPGDKACDDPTRPDPPTKFGGCADCHAPGIDGPGVPATGGQSLHAAKGVAYANGNHCDVCHHVARVDLKKAPGLAGALEIRRPREKLVEGDPTSKPLQAMYGPLVDVVNPFMGGVYSPVFETAELCGGCHEDHQPALAGGALDPVKSPSGLEVHTTYSEWRDSPFNTPATPCSFCHMPAPSTPGFNSVDVSTAGDAGIAFGFGRPPEDRRQHTFLGPLAGTPRLIDSALSLSTTAVQSGATLKVTATVKNVGAGHAIPTGEPMRGLVLLVQASCGAPLVAIGGQTISDVGGAHATGVVGAGVAFAGSTVTWPSASAAKAGDVVRVVRASGAFDDYLGNGYFAGPLSPAEKGIAISAPVGEATVISATAGTLTLSSALPVADGDVVFLGDPTISTLVDGAPSLDLAGAPGNAFAKVLVDPGGARLVPHYRGIDIASDNRIPPQKAQVSEHSFALPPPCTRANVTTTLLYRPTVGAVALDHAWDARSFVVGQDSLSIVVAP
ncbi:MAG: hypothetical protein U0414_28505 [Polyangiaceae bacterium]